LPRIKIKIFGQASEDICNLEEAKYLVNFESRIVLVEGQRVASYEELVQLAAQDKYRNREYIEAVLLPVIAGGELPEYKSPWAT
jgi:hypothetical protein